MRLGNRRVVLWTLSATLASFVVLGPIAEAFDTETEFAQGTKVFGLQIGGGEQNNIEDQRSISHVSFVNFSPRVSYFLLPPFGSGLLRSALEPGLEGWFQYYLSPKQATAEGLKLALRYHLIGFGRLVPYVEVTGGAAGTSLHVPEAFRSFTFVLEGGIGVSYFVADGLAAYAGYRLQHISNGNVYHCPSCNRGFESDSGVAGVSFFFK